MGLGLAVRSWPKSLFLFANYSQVTGLGHLTKRITMTIIEPMARIPESKGISEPESITIQIVSAK